MYVLLPSPLFKNVTTVTIKGTYNSYFDGKRRKVCFENLPGLNRIVEGLEYALSLRLFLLCLYPAINLSLYPLHGGYFFPYTIYKQRKNSLTILRGGDTNLTKNISH